MNVYNLNDYFEFHFNLSRFDTGVATDADSLPTWRCYEENNDTVVTNDNCAKRDDANTTGYYYARGQITGVAGYEVGKNYVVRAAATVNSVAAAAVIGTFKVVSVTRGLAGTALPDAAADAAGGLPISDAGALDLDTLNSNVSAVLADTGTDGVVIAAGAITATAIAGDAITAAKIANGAIDAATFATNSITADALAADAVTEIQTGLALEATALAIKAKTDNLPSGIAKNVALNNFEFVMIDSGDHITPLTSATVSGTISQDGGAFAGLANSVTEVASGVYKISLTQAEMNADVITLIFTASGADTRILTLLTS